MSATPARAPDIDATTTPINSDVAQGAPVPLGTVTLAGQAAAGQGTEQGADQNRQEQRLQQNDLFFTPNFLANLGLGQTANANDAGGASQTPSEQTNATRNASASASATTQVLQGISTPGTGTQQNLEESQKQQLQELNQTLRQLGIDPQSVSVFNQLAFLFYANNPAGLGQFIAQFQQAAQQLLDQNSSQAVSQNVSSAAVAAASQMGTPAVTSSDATAGISTQTASGSQGTVNSSSHVSEASLQFQDLQSAVAAVEGQLQMSATGAKLEAEGESLNVTF